MIQNCQPKPTNTENPNPNTGILRSKPKITKMRSEFLFLGIYLCVDEHGEWVWKRKKERQNQEKKMVGGGVGLMKKERKKERKKKRE